MGKTRDLFKKIEGFLIVISLQLIKINGKKIEGIKGTFHVRMDTIKDRNNSDLTEAKDIKKRWRECIGKLCKKKKKSYLPGKPQSCGHSLRSRYPGV